MIINIEADNHNKETYETYGLHRDEAGLYTCVLCNNKTSISDSVSNRGHKLTCMHCIRTKFKTTHDGFMWVASPDDAEESTRSE